MELAKELISIPSFTGEESAVAHHVRDTLEMSGLPVEIHGSDERPVITSTINPEASPFIVFNGHLDTVPIADLEAWTQDPFDPRMEDGKLYGRGSCDMKASKGVLALEKGIDKYHPWIGHPVLSVNSIKAGTVINQVPAECVIGIDRRLIIGETAESVVDEVTKTLDEAGRGDPGWRWELEAERNDNGGYVYSPPSYTAPDTELVKAFYQDVPLAMGVEPELFVEWAGGTDGRFYRYAGIQTVGFGPRGEHAHGPNEFVYIDSLIFQVRVYLAMVLTQESKIK